MDRANSKTHRGLSRRRFLQGSLLAAGLNIPARSWSQILGSNGDIRVGVVGLNGQGRTHIEGFRNMPGVRVVALCDCDGEVLSREVRKFHARAEQVLYYTDIRKLLEDPDVDVVSIATPNHWHALATVWSCQAGRDVYVEKPVSHNVWEGRQMVAAARKYGRMVQTGTQSRSSAGVKEAIQFVQSGQLGAIQAARGLCYKRRKTIGRVNGAQPLPGALIYDLWTGPAPLEELKRYRLHYDWHWFWNYGNGDLGNQGIHEMDMARWALGESALAPKVQSVGGRFGYIDDGQTANTQVSVHRYPKAPLIFEVRGLPEAAGSSEMPAFAGARIGVVVHCADGDLVIEANHATAYDLNKAPIRTFGDPREDHRLAHRTNFIEAVRARRHTHLNADIAEGHLSSALCHTANISYRLGEPQPVARIRSEARNDRELGEAFESLREHLAANRVDLELSQARLGPRLELDPVTETFIDSKRANALMRREYRKGFEVPELT